jgi:predicted nuclease with TOPRIM domain
LANYLNNLKLQIEEHNTLIKSKNRTIEELQNSIATSLSRSDELDKLTVENSKLRSSLNAALQEVDKLKFAEDHLSKSKTLSANHSRK